MLFPRNYEYIFAGVAGVVVIGISYYFIQSQTKKRKPDTKKPKDVAPHAFVSGLTIFPVKSCTGTPVNEIELDKYGVVGDRNFMVVNAKGEFLTQRQVPKMCQIVPLFSGDKRHLSLSCPGHNSIVINLKSLQRSHPRRMQVRIWDDHAEAFDTGAETHKWLSEVLATECYLVYMGSKFVRTLNDRKYVPTTMIAQRHVNFSDGYPLLLATEESLKELNKWLQTPIPMNRFRPNVIVRGCARPFEEESWYRILIGNSEFLCVKPCSRCKVPCTDQSTGERSDEPSVTLGKHRKVKIPQHDLNGQVIFGMNLIHVKTNGGIHVGDEVVVLERRKPLIDDTHYRLHETEAAATVPTTTAASASYIE